MNLNSKQCFESVKLHPLLGTIFKFHNIRYRPAKFCQTNEDTIVLEQDTNIIAIGGRTACILITLYGDDGDIIFDQGSSISRNGFDALSIVFDSGTFLE